jgi:hypothetical protein
LRIAVGVTLILTGMIRTARGSSKAIHYLLRVRELAVGRCWSWLGWRTVPLCKASVYAA